MTVGRDYVDSKDFQHYKTHILTFHVTEMNYVIGLRQILRPDGRPTL